MSEIDMFVRRLQPRHNIFSFGLLRVSLKEVTVSLFIMPSFAGVYIMMYIEDYNVIIHCDVMFCGEEWFLWRDIMPSIARF